MDQGGERLDDAFEEEHDDSQGWYFDLPTGAWERQVEKHRTLREGLLRAEKESDGPRDPFTGQRSTGRKRFLFGRKKDGQEDEAPTPRFQQRSSDEERVSRFRALRDAEDGGDDWSTEPPAPPAPSADPDDDGPLLRSRESAEMPATEEGGSRWEQMFGASADGGLLEGMRAWARGTEEPEPEHEEEVTDNVIGQETDAQEDDDIPGILSRNRRRDEEAPAEAGPAIDGEGDDDIPDLLQHYREPAEDAEEAAPAEPSLEDEDTRAAMQAWAESRAGAAEEHEHRRLDPGVPGPVRASTEDEEWPAVHTDDTAASALEAYLSAPVDEGFDAMRAWAEQPMEATEPAHRHILPVEKPEDAGVPDDTRDLEVEEVPDPAGDAEAASEPEGPGLLRRLFGRGKRDQAEPEQDPESIAAEPAFDEYMARSGGTAAYDPNGEAGWGGRLGAERRNVTPETANGDWVFIDENEPGDMHPGEAGATSPVSKYETDRSEHGYDEPSQVSAPGAAFVFEVSEGDLNVPGDDEESVNEPSSVENVSGASTTNDIQTGDGMAGAAAERQGDMAARLPEDTRDVINEDDSSDDDWESDVVAPESSSEASGKTDAEPVEAAPANKPGLLRRLFGMGTTPAEPAANAEPSGIGDKGPAAPGDVQEPVATRDDDAAPWAAFEMAENNDSFGWGKPAEEVPAASNDAGADEKAAPWAAFQMAESNDSFGWGKPAEDAPAASNDAGDEEKAAPWAAFEMAGNNDSFGWGKPAEDAPAASNDAGDEEKDAPWAAFEIAGSNDSFGWGKPAEDAPAASGGAGDEEKDAPWAAFEMAESNDSFGWGKLAEDAPAASDNAGDAEPPEWEPEIDDEAPEWEPELEDEESGSWSAAMPAAQALAKESAEGSDDSRTNMPGVTQMPLALDGRGDEPHEGADESPSGDGPDWSIYHLGGDEDGDSTPGAAANGEAEELPDWSSAFDSLTREDDEADGEAAPSGEDDAAASEYSPRMFEERGFREQKPGGLLAQAAASLSDDEEPRDRGDEDPNEPDLWAAIADEAAQSGDEQALNQPAIFGVYGYREQEDETHESDDSFVPADVDEADEGDLVLRAFEAHAARYDDGERNDASEPAESRPDEFNDLLGDDADDIVEDSAVAATGGVSYARMQGWSHGRQPAGQDADDDDDDWVAAGPGGFGGGGGTGSIALGDPGDFMAAREERKHKTRTLVRELVETGLLALLVFLAVRASFQNFKVDGSSMQPTLENGQFLIVNKLVYSEIDMERLGSFVPFVDAGDTPTRHVFHGAERGDIIVLRDPGNPDVDLIKRVVGLPGDKLEIVEGAVYIDDFRLEEPYIQQEWSADHPAVQIPEDHYFVMGDNRDNSKDSRSSAIGFIDEDLIIGRAELRYLPLDAFGRAPNTDPTISEDERPVVTSQKLDE